MKYLIVFALLVVFAATCFASTSRDEILSQIEALDAAKEALLSQLDQPEQDVEHLSERSFPLERCVNTNNLNVRNDNGDTTGEKLNDNTPVTVWAIKEMRGLDYAKIGYGRWVAAKFLKMECSKTDKAEESLIEIFGHEGQCQNWNSDSGNWMNGKLGYTCMGIIPSVGWNSRSSAFGYAASGYRGSSEMFVKYAYDKDRAQFKKGASLIYKRDYFDRGGCANLPMPAYYVCGDIAINSGIGKSLEYVRALGPLQSTSMSTVKKYAKQLNEKHRQFYKIIGAPGKKNNKFLKGWLARADSRDRFIDRY